MDNVTELQPFLNSSANDDFTELGLEPGTFQADLVELPPYIRAPEWTRVFVRILQVVMSVVGTIGNSLLIAGLRRKKGRCSTDVYCIGKAVADLTTLLINSPVNFLRFTPELWAKVGSTWLCKLHFHIIHAAPAVSSILILSIGIDRYLKVFRPHFPVGRLNRISKIMCLVAFTSSAVFCVPFIFVSYVSPMGHCQYNPSYKIVFSVTYGTLLLIMLISSIVLGWIYYNIAKKIEECIRKSTNKPQNGSIELTARPTSSATQGTRVPPAKAMAILGHSASFIIPNNEPCIGAILSSIEPPQTTSKRAFKIGDKEMRRTTRTTWNMALTTSVFTITTVIPCVALALLMTLGPRSESMAIFMFIATKLPLIDNVANPFIFAMGSSEFRGIIASMFKWSSNANGF